jgi:H+-transporting ATPase
LVCLTHTFLLFLFSVGKETARLIGLGTNIHAGEEIRHAQPQEKKDLIWEADGFASVLPSDKREVVLTLRNEFGIVTGMTGDGVSKCSTNISNPRCSHLFSPKFVFCTISDDAPALSAAQVGIAVHGATDAAKNAADLILTEPGLSPIYGAVLESRRIFARIKAYVIYRVAASLILALTLSIVIFASGCAVDSLLVIILALLNDISMIPVAYDNAKATTKPQMPDAGKLVLQSVFYGLLHTGAALLFIFTLNHAGELGVVLEDQCNAETRGFIWFYLVLVTELTIFSVRAPSHFWRSMPSPLLMLSVLGTCIGGALIAVYASDLSAVSMGWIVLYNLVVFVFVDLLKVQFRKIIHEDPGEPIESDELIPVKVKTETTMYVEKQMRYRVHKEAVLSPDDLDHPVQFRQESLMSGFLGDFTITDGFLNENYRRTRALALPRAARRKTQSSPSVFSS